MDTTLMRTLRPFVLAGVAVSAMFGLAGFALGATSLLLSGGRTLPLVLQGYALSAACLLIDAFTLTIVSPGRDPAHYPRMAIAVLSGHLRKARRDRQQGRAERAASRRLADVEGDAHGDWEALLEAADATGTRTTLHDLRTRAAEAQARLAGSLDPDDIAAMLLLDKTAPALIGAANKRIARDPASASDVIRRLPEALEAMVSAAESRAQPSDRFDELLSHGMTRAGEIGGGRQAC